MKAQKSVKMIPEAHLQKTENIVVENVFLQKKSCQIRCTIRKGHTKMYLKAVLPTQRALQPRRVFCESRLFMRGRIVYKSRDKAQKTHD